MCVATEEGSGLGAELAGIRVPRDRWVLDKKALETGEPEEAQEPREATKGEASGSRVIPRTRPEHRKLRVQRVRPRL